MTWGTEHRSRPGSREAGRPCVGFSERFLGYTAKVGVTAFELTRPVVWVRPPRSDQPWTLTLSDAHERAAPALCGKEHERRRHVKRAEDDTQEDPPRESRRPDRSAAGAIPEQGGGPTTGGVVAKPSWTFLTNHAHVLLCITDEPDIRGRDIGARVGITERATQTIIADLVAAGYIRRRREGRRNRYSVDPDGPMRHPLDHGHTVGELLTALGHLPPPIPNGGGRPRKP